ncbi:uncharacterized protein PFL1_04652 [Pseudozyma flocculosa PF-1]|uniref:GATA-type domain-containing protein n=2 Tax=Pseudozyma flocculosa TaxID=84751 RepID=A0A5C3FDY7_9BASI|nr:uncharacterized protein PFL1_04652 [Pseudozyma flocculosa PF-1]EPQ27908.1 hypothetical protein PFL1_04652 [Pseudozyma flocculosa PF-1]SPO41691.1 uncharacterized protein PSFLO_07173 [Pseudozyma flocculosa]
MSSGQVDADNTGNGGAGDIHSSHEHDHTQSLFGSGLVKASGMHFDSEPYTHVGDTLSNEQSETKDASRLDVSSDHHASHQSPPVNGVTSPQQQQPPPPAPQQQQQQQQQESHGNAALTPHPEPPQPEPSGAAEDGAQAPIDDGQPDQHDLTHAATLQALAELQSSSVSAAYAEAPKDTTAASSHPQDGPSAGDDATASREPGAAPANGIPSDAPQGPEQASSSATGDSQAAPAASTAEPTLSKKIAEDLRGIHAAAATIANFTAAHINKGAIPRAIDVQAAVGRALSITQALTSLLSSPEIAAAAPNDDQTRSLYDFSAPSTPSRAGPLNMLATYSPYDLSVFSSGRKRGGGGPRQSTARKRRRSEKGDAKAEPGGDAAAGGNQSGSGQTQAGGDAPRTPGGSTLGPDDSMDATGSSAKDSSEHKGPVYKKRSRAPVMSPCASCGTLETPEWRRGPDGARTLCNACGLHYSKLVRNRQRAMQEELPEGGIPLVPPPPVTIEELRASTKAHNIGGAPPGRSGGGAGDGAGPSGTTGINGTPSRSSSDDRSFAMPVSRAPTGLESTMVSSSASLPLLSHAGGPSDVAAPTTTSSHDDSSIAPQLRNQGVGEMHHSPLGVSDAPAVSSSAATASIPSSSAAPAVSGAAAVGAMQMHDDSTVHVPAAPTPAPIMTAAEGSHDETSKTMGMDASIQAGQQAEPPAHQLGATTGDERPMDEA